MAWSNFSEVAAGAARMRVNSQRAVCKNVCSLAHNHPTSVFGINDLKTIPLFPQEEERIIADCSANLRRMVERSRELRARVVITTLFPLGKLPLQRRLFWSDRVDPAIARINQGIKSMASDDVIVIDTAKVLGDAEGRMVPAYSRDFLHLSAEGYERLNAELSRSVELFIAR